MKQYFHPAQKGEWTRLWMTEPFYLPVRIQFTISKILWDWKENGINGDKCKACQF
jgi:hypothetical protein